MICISRLKPCQFCVGVERRHVVYKAWEGRRGVCVWEKEEEETAKTRKLYLSLLDWLIIELPRSCIEQSVLCEKKYFSLKSISLLAQQRGGNSFLSVWAADWITKASREQVYSFSLTKKQQQEKCPGWERKESSSEFQSQRAAGRHRQRPRSRKQPLDMLYGSQRIV